MKSYGLIFLSRVSGARLTQTPAELTLVAFAREQFIKRDWPAIVTEIATQTHYKNHD